MREDVFAQTEADDMQVVWCITNMLYFQLLIELVFLAVFNL